MDKVRSFLAPFRAHILRTAKAYTASLVVAALAQISARGVEVPADVAEAAQLVAVAVVAWFFTWLIPNSR